MEYIYLYLFHAELSICKPNSKVNGCQQKWNWAANCSANHNSRILTWLLNKHFKNILESSGFTHFKVCLNSKEKKNLENIPFNLEAVEGQMSKNMHVSTGLA